MCPIWLFAASFSYSQTKPPKHALSAAVPSCQAVLRFPPSVLCPPSSVLGRMTTFVQPLKRENAPRAKSSLFLPTPGVMRFSGLARTEFRHDSCNTALDRGAHISKGVSSICGTRGTGRYQVLFSSKSRLRLMISDHGGNPREQEIAAMLLAKSGKCRGFEGRALWKEAVGGSLQSVVGGRSGFPVGSSRSPVTQGAGRIFWAGFR